MNKKGGGRYETHAFGNPDWRWAVRVNYTSGAYSLISCDGYGTDYDADGERIDTNHFGCDNEEGKDLIMRYLSIAES